MATAGSNSDKKRATQPIPDDAADNSEDDEALTLQECFVIMPISDPEGYPDGHFRRVYEDIFRPACKKAGFKAVRADESKQTDLIHLDVLQRIVETPLALCDLSTRNPNVLFELGLRQAFDKPVVLVREVGTDKIFDVDPLRYTNYRRELLYREVLEDQENIAESIKATMGAATSARGINSLIQLLKLPKPASLPEVVDSTDNPMMQLVLAELRTLRAQIESRSSYIDEHPMLAKTQDVSYLRGFALGLLDAGLSRAQAVQTLVDHGMTSHAAEGLVRRATVQHLKRRLSLGAEPGNGDPAALMTPPSDVYG